MAHTVGLFAYFPVGCYPVWVCGVAQRPAFKAIPIYNSSPLLQYKISILPVRMPLSWVPSVEGRQVDDWLHLQVLLLEPRLIFVFGHAVVHLVALLEARFYVGARSSCLAAVSLELGVSLGHVTDE